MSGELYDTLGLTQNASDEEIKKAFHQQARRFHPDLNPDEAAAEMFLGIKEAYETLSDPQKRQDYDQQIALDQTELRPVRMNFITSRKSIPRLPEDQLIYALLELECESKDQFQEKTQAQICLVIDTSTSMRGPRINMVIENINQLLVKMDANDLFSVVTFNDEAQVLIPPSRVKNVEMIRKKLTPLSTSGGTEIRKGLKAGIDLLWQGNDDNLSSYLVLLTDGHTYGDEEQCFTLANQAVRQGIQINGLGIGNEWNATFLEKLTSLTGGSTLFVRSKEDLGNYLERVFESVNDIFARKVTLFHLRDSRVEMRSLMQLNPSIIQYEVHSGKTPLGDLYFGKKSLFLLEFLIHPLIKKDKDVELLTGQIKMELSGEDKRILRLFPFYNLPVVDEVVKEKPPEEIVKALSRLNMYMMQERSREDVNVGSYNRATRRLNYLASRLFEEGEVHLASKAYSESELIQKTHHFSNNGEKELKYGTKSLLGLPNPIQRKEI